MCNLKKWVLEAADGKPIQAIVIGNMGWSDYGLDDLPPIAKDTANWNRVLTWDAAAALIDYEFNAGFGAPGCQAITAWTEDRVIFISQYDGSTNVEWVPRNPVDHKPSMPGG